MARVSGTCKWFDVRKGFGFLAPNDGGEDIFVHQSELMANGFRSLGEGEEVEFEIVKDENDNDKLKASKVTGPNGAELQGAKKRRRRKKKKSESRAPQEKIEAIPNSIFVANLSWDTSDEQLSEHFADYNPTNVEVKKYNETRSKGYGIVSFGTEDDAQRAVADKHESELDGRVIVCRVDRGSTVREEPKKTESAPQNSGKTVFVGNLPWSVTDDELASQFSSLQGFDSAEIVKKNNGLSKGFGFVNFQNAEDASSLVESEQVYTFGEGEDAREASIMLKESRSKKKAKAKKKKEKNVQEVPTSGKFLFVGNVSWETSSSELGQHFSEQEGLASAEIKVDNNGRSRGFGIVEFDTNEQASHALDALNGSELMGRPIAVRYDREQQ